MVKNLFLHWEGAITNDSTGRNTRYARICLGELGVREALNKFRSAAPCRVPVPIVHVIMTIRKSGGKCMNQMSFSEVEFAAKKKCTRRERFLD
jgi:hypothetical protein